MSDLDTPNHRAQAVIGRWQFLALRMNVCGYRHQETQSIGIALYQRALDANIPMTARVAKT